MLSSAATEPAESWGQKHALHITAVYGGLAFLSFGLFGALHLVVEHNGRLGSLELCAAAAVGLMLIGLRLGVSLATARACLLLTMIAMLVVMLTTGGTHGTGIYWFFLFPIAAFFLAGTREGTYWVAALFVVLAVIWFAGYVTDVPMYYSGIEIRQLAVTLLLVGIGLYAYQHFREASLAQVQSSHSELQQHLDQMAAAQQELDAAKSEFLALASHQLRTPVSGIRWSSEMLLSGDLGELTEEQHDCIQGIEENNKRLADILSDMLLISNLDLNKLEVQAELVDVASLSRKTFANEVKKSKGKNIEIEEAYRADVPKLRVDEKIMATVLQHLYSNAIKYTPAGGKIMLSVKHDPERLYEGSKGSILIEVADTGYGIPHTQQKHVFAKMFRATNAKNKDTDGTGLGLYLVKALLDRVGGRIWFESEEGRGTTFWVLLPQEGMQRLDGSPRRNKDDA